MVRLGCLKDVVRRHRDYVLKLLACFSLLPFRAYESSLLKFGGGDEDSFQKVCKEKEKVTLSF